MRNQVKLSRWLAVVSLIALIIGVNGSASADANSRYFGETGHTVTQPFLDYWNTHGALAQQGYPITDDYQELNDADGHIYRTQYFERSRFEYHPEQTDPQYQVLLGLLGKEAFNAKYPGGLPSGTQTQVVPGGGSFLFTQTGHSVTGLFLSYWQNHGGLAQQGYPISEAYMELNDADGQMYITQYFERARFEYHPEQSNPQYKVLLGLVGTEIYQRKQHGGQPTNTPAPSQPTNTPLPSAPTNTPTSQPTNTPTAMPTGTPTNTPAAPVVTQVFAQSNIAAGSTGHATVACTSGTYVTGGGWASNTNLDVYNSSMDSNGWQVYASNTSASSQLLNSYAVCMSGLSVAPTEESTQVSVGAGQHAGGSKACGGSEHVTGGGFAKNTGEHIYNESPDGNGWSAYAYNTGGGSLLLNVYAMCYAGNMTSTTRLTQVNVAASSTGQSVANCLAGTLATGGGFAGNDDLLVYTTDRDGNGWEAYASNSSGSPQLLNAYAVCVSLP